MKVFAEEQKFKRWIILSILTVPLIIGISLLFIKEENIPEFNSEDFWGLTITFLIVGIVLLMILSIRLQTKINEQGVYYQFFPIHLTQKFIPWQDISECYLLKYNSLTQYGGYGYRIGLFKNKGTALNVGGEYGIQLVLKNGKKLLIGTQNKNDAERILITYKSKLTLNEK